MYNNYEAKLNYKIDRHRRLQGVLVERRKRRVAGRSTIAEKELQKWAAEYFNRVLIPTEAYYEGHESGIGLGLMSVQTSDSEITRKFKEGYNRFFNQFVMPVQRFFQAKGITKGSPDGFLFAKGRVINIEFKVDYNKASGEQKEFADKAALLGNPTEYPRTQDDVMAIPVKYGIKTRANQS